MTDSEMVLQYLQDFGSITPLQAHVDLGILKLGARIYDLRKDGYPISTKRHSYTTRYGKKKWYGEYRLEEKQC